VRARLLIRKPDDNAGRKTYISRKPKGLREMAYVRLPKSARNVLIKWLCDGFEEFDPHLTN